MSEYFRPSKIWVGKLCYVKIDWAGRREIMLSCQISAIKSTSTTRCLRVEVVLANHDCEWVDHDLIFDRIDGHTDFYDVPGGKP